MGSCEECLGGGDGHARMLARGCFFFLFFFFGCLLVVVVLVVGDFVYWSVVQRDEIPLP